MPGASRLIGGEGVTFDRAYINFPLCCPSRAAMLTGQYMHNNEVRGNGGEFGGWERFVDTGGEAKALPTWLTDAGYYNVAIGKYMNGYGGRRPPIPPGWDEWYGKYSEYDDTVQGGRIYFNYSMREDPPEVGGVPCPSGGPDQPGEPFTCKYGQRESDYQTDVVGVKAVEAIERLSGPDSPQTPFFLKVDFNAPHSPYIPAPRHAGIHVATPIAPPASENEDDISDKPRFLRRLPRLGAGKLAQIVTRRRARLEMLMSVDDAVREIVTRAGGRGPAREHLRHLHLRQRPLQRRAPDPPGQVPAPRGVEPGPPDDPRPGHPLRRELTRPLSRTPISPRPSPRSRAPPPRCCRTASRCSRSPPRRRQTATAAASCSRATPARASTTRVPRAPPI